MASNFIVETQASLFYTKLAQALQAQEGFYNLILGISQRLAQQEKKSAGAQSPQNPALMAYLELDSATQLYLVQSSPQSPLLLASQATDPLSIPMPELLDFLVAYKLEPQSIVAPRSLVLHFTEAWKKRFAQPWQQRMAQGVYRLEQVTPARACPGTFRLAQETDADCLSAWEYDFVAEAIPQELETLEAYARAVQAQIQAQKCFVWEDQGQVVSMVARARETPNGTAISLVYTPPELRGRGYASACVAALSQFLLDEGKAFCCLFTDLSNPTSNQIYQRLGYKKVGEFAHFDRV